MDGSTLQGQRDNGQPLTSTSAPKAAATPNAYIIQEALHKSSTAPVDKDVQKERESERENPPKSYTSLKGYEEAAVLKEQQKRLYADDRWLFLHL